MIIEWTTKSASLQKKSHHFFISRWEQIRDESNKPQFNSLRKNNWGVVDVETYGVVREAWGSKLGHFFKVNFQVRQFLMKFDRKSLKVDSNTLKIHKINEFWKSETT